MANAKDISAIIKDQIKKYGVKIKEEEVGRILTVGDGIALVSGLDNAKLGELLSFPHDIFGMVLSLNEDTIGVALTGEAYLLKEDDEVKRTSKVVSVPVGDGLIGRVVNAIGKPLDGKGPIKSKQKRLIFRVAPGVMTREEVNQPLETGIISIDSMIPIGKGQRELIIGDRQTGKTAIAIDTILNQKGKDVNCIYVAIGQKNSSVAQIVNKLENHGAMKYTTVVNASAGELAPMQYLAPYAGVTIGEEWMEKGKDVLIIYDDLSKHAVSYRTLSLLLRRPPGREAYPGDVFYLHSQLLERAARVNQENGGGSITALPIIETQSGDISAYIPTNVISITDGQIFTNNALFNAGQRPAVDVGFSVSRVGGSAQVQAMKQTVSSLKLELAQYNEMEAFAQFGSDLDASTRIILEHGAKVYEILKQQQYSPIDEVQQIILLYAVKRRIINPVPKEYIARYKEKILSIIQSKKNDSLQKIVEEIAKTKKISKHSEAKLNKLLYIFTKKFLEIIPHYDPKAHPPSPFTKTSSSIKKVIATKVVSKEKPFEKIKKDEEKKSSEQLSKDLDSQIKVEQDKSAWTQNIEDHDFTIEDLHIDENDTEATNNFEDSE